MSDWAQTQAWLRDAGFVAKDEALWLEALTHGSVGGAHDYQRLEFLGDRVLGLSIAEWLFETQADAAEGALAQRLNALVSKHACARVARRIGVSEHVRLGKQARDDGAAESDNILGDVMESLLGAQLREAGFDSARDLVRSLWADAVEGDTGRAKHPKSALQEWAAGNRRRPPEYALVDRSGPDHAARFTVRVSVHNVGEAEATASSKQEAETAAAKAFMERYGERTLALAVRQAQGERDMTDTNDSTAEGGKPERVPAAAAQPERSPGGANSGEEKQKCGVVAVLGAPNAGKSTLVNALVGQKVAITSAKAQTTRARMLGIALHENDTAKTQMILVDTPGIFAPRRRLDRAMVSAAWEGAESADAVLLLVDPIKQRRHELEPLVEQLATRSERKILVLNKVDKAKKEPLLALAQELAGKVDFAEIYFISALTGDGVSELKDALAGLMPEGVWMYPEDQVSDASERLLATEITREQLYRQLHEELPYDSMVRPEKYIERKDGSVEIHQQIVVARDNQRAIVLGKGGSRIKEIGKAAREELSEILGRKVHLFLHVKATENWSEDKEMFEEIGLDWVR